MKYLAGFPVVDEDSEHAHSPGHGKGYVSRDYESFPLNSLHCSQEAGDIQLIPRSEWKERIEEKTAKKTWITDHCDRVGLKVKNQEQTNYCWINAPVHCMEIDYVMQGGALHVLSAACAGSQIMGYRNVGGSGIVGVKWLSEHGVCTEAIWPKNKIDPKYLTDNAKQNSILHRVTKWLDIDPRDHDKIVSALLQDRPVSVGIPVWQHEVTLTFLVWDGGDAVPGIDNSWGPGYGAHGRAILKGQYKNFDESGCVMSVTPAVA